MLVLAYSLFRWGRGGKRRSGCCSFWADSWRATTDFTDYTGATHAIGGTVVVLLAAALAHRCAPGSSPGPN